MDIWMSVRTNRWMNDWINFWVNVCVGCLLVVDLLGLWRGVKPVSQATINKHRTHIFTQPCIQSSIHSTFPTYSHPHIHSPTHSSTHPCIHMHDALTNG